MGLAASLKQFIHGSYPCSDRSLSWFCVLFLCCIVFAILVPKWVESSSESCVETELLPVRLGDGELAVRFRAILLCFLLTLSMNSDKLSLLTAGLRLAMSISLLLNEFDVHGVTRALS